MMEGERATTQPVQPEQFPIAVVWPESLGDAAQVVNQFVVSNDISDLNGIYLLFGNVSTPVYLDPVHAKQRMEERGNAVQVTPRGAFYMTRQNLRMLNNIISEHLGKENAND